MGTRHQTKTVKVKLQRNWGFKPTVTWQKDMWWVNLSTGGYFAIYKNDDGTWSHWGNLQRRFDSDFEAMQEYLSASREENLKSRAQYLKRRAKEHHIVIPF